MQQQLAMRLAFKTSCCCLTTRLDSADVDLVNDMFIQHVQCGAIHMNLADGAGNLGLIVHSIGFEGWDHDLNSKTMVVIASAFMLS